MSGEYFHTSINCCASASKSPTFLVQKLVFTFNFNMQNVTQMLETAAVKVTEAYCLSCFQCLLATSIYSVNFTFVLIINKAFIDIRLSPSIATPL